MMMSGVKTATTRRWTTEDIARELGLTAPGADRKAAQATGRQQVRRWRANGIELDVEIHPRTGEKSYLPEQIRDAHETSSPGRGTRTDLTAQRIGELMALARTLAESAGRYDEWARLDEQVMAGSAAAVRTVIECARVWAGLSRALDTLARIEKLSGRIGALGSAVLSVRMRERIAAAAVLRADAAAAEGPRGPGAQPR